jgi:hypothetical protein
MDGMELKKASETGAAPGGREGTAPMPIFLVYCGGGSKADRDYFSLTFDDTFAQRLLRHLAADPDYCNGCGVLCDHCRDTYGIDFSGEVADALQLPGVLPYYLEDPLGMLGGELPPHEVTIAVNLHEELLLALPEAAARAGSRLLLAPSEAPGWTSGWIRNKVRSRCRELGMHADFPKPFCSLRRGVHPAQDRFIERFRVGRPELELEVRDGYVKEARVRVSAPCGNTYFVAFNLKGVPADRRAVEAVAKYWHSFPCTASMEMDREAGDTILHLGGYLHYEALRAALEREGVAVEVPKPRRPL